MKGNGKSQAHFKLKIIYTKKMLRLEHRIEEKKNTPQSQQSTNELRYSYYPYEYIVFVVINRYFVT